MKRLHRVAHLTEEKMKTIGVYYRGGTRDPGQMDTELLERNCSENACSVAAITSLDQRALCLNHFLLRCYAKLEAVDPRSQKSREDSVDLPSMRAFIEECSQKALEISLQSENLTNLERGRLLDILLWSGELFVLLRAPRITLADSSPSGDSSKPARAASPRT
jgi:hypothetical protein